MMIIFGRITAMQWALVGFFFSVYLSILFDDFKQGRTWESYSKITLLIFISTMGLSVFFYSLMLTMLWKNSGIPANLIFPSALILNVISTAAYYLFYATWRRSCK